MSLHDEEAAYNVCLARIRARSSYLKQFDMIILHHAVFRDLETKKMVGTMLYSPPSSQ